MTMSVQIPTALQPFVQAEIAAGKYANEQEFVTKLLELARETKNGCDQIRAAVQRSIEQADRGDVSPLNMDEIKSKLADELDKFGQRK